MGWTEAIVGTVIGGVALALLPLYLSYLVSLLFVIPWLYYLLRYVIEVGNSPERYKTIASFGFAFLCVLIPVGILMPAAQKAHETAERMAVSNSLRQIGVAFHAHETDNGHLPPSAITDKHGKPLLSWRVAILPYVDEIGLYRTLNLDEPWDSEHNMRVLHEHPMPKVYAPPGGARKGEEHLTHYRIFVGKGTLYPNYPNNQHPVLYRPRHWANLLGTPSALSNTGPFCYPSPRLVSIHDGTSNTILAVEAAEAVPWTKPDELEYDRSKPLPRLGRQNAGYLLGTQNARYFQVVLFDASVRRVRKDVDEQTLRWAIEPADGMPLPSDWGW
jgi:hypothetical protein